MKWFIRLLYKYAFLGAKVPVSVEFMSHKFLGIYKA